MELQVKINRGDIAQRTISLSFDRYKFIQGEEGRCSSFGPEFVLTYIWQRTAESHCPVKASEDLRHRKDDCRCHFERRPSSSLEGTVEPGAKNHLRECAPSRTALRLIRTKHSRRLMVRLYSTADYRGGPRWSSWRRQGGTTRRRVDVGKRLPLRHSRSLTCRTLESNAHFVSADARAAIGRPYDQPVDAPSCLPQLRSALRGAAPAQTAPPCPGCHRSRKATNGSGPSGRKACCCGGLASSWAGGVRRRGSSTSAASDDDEAGGGVSQEARFMCPAQPPGRSHHSNRRQE